MEDVLAVYTRPRDPDYPLVCLDETSKQFLAETRLPIPMKRGRPARCDYEYERNGTAIEHDVKAAWHDTREVFALVIDWNSPELADQGGVPPVSTAPQLEPRHAAEYEQRLTDCTGSSMHQYALCSLHRRSA